MRDLSSRSLAGPEAVMTALLAWWLSKHPGLADRAISAPWHTSLKSLREDDVGHAIWEASAFGRAEDRFWAECREDPAARSLVEQCVAAWRAAPRQSAVKGVRGFVRTSLLRMLARRARESGKIPSRVGRRPPGVRGSGG